MKGYFQAQDDGIKNGRIIGDSDYAGEDRGIGGRAGPDILMGRRTYSRKFNCSKFSHGLV